MSKQGSKTQSRVWVEDEGFVSTGSSLRRRRSMECKCGDFAVIRTVNDTSNPNCGKKFWGCNNYRNSFEKGCGFFKLVDDEDFCTEFKEEGLELKLKSEKTKRKNMKLKMDLAKTKNWLKLSLVFGFVSFGTCLVLGTVILCK